MVPKCTRLGNWHSAFGRMTLCVTTDSRCKPERGAESELEVVECKGCMRARGVRACGIGALDIGASSQDVIRMNAFDVCQLPNRFLAVK